MVRPERVLSGISQGLVLRLLLFLVYINDLPDSIQSICKIFANEWAFPWNMDHDPKKQTIEVCFSQKIVRDNPKTLSFNQSQVKTFWSHKNLGLILNTKLTSKEQLENKKCTVFMKKLSLVLSSMCLLTIYKAFGRLHQDFADIIYGKPDDGPFKDQLQKIQYTAAIAITRTNRGISGESITMNSVQSL